MIELLKGAVGIVTGRWKMILVGLAALAIVSTVGAGYIYVKGLQNDLQEARAEVVRLKTTVSLLEQSLAIAKKHIEDTRKAMEDLAEANAASEAEWRDLLGEINELPAACEPEQQKDETNEPTDPPTGTDQDEGTSVAPPVKKSSSDADGINDLNRRLNRMLERITEGG